jgi:tight adherence protein B
MTHPALLAAAALAVILAAAFVWASAAERRRRAVQTRLASVLTAAPQAATGRISLRRSAGRRANPFGLLPRRIHERIAGELSATADRLSIWDLVVTALIGVLISGGLFAAVLQWPMLLAGPLMLGTALALPAARLRFAQRRFQKRFLETFPESLDVLVRAVRAGLPVLDAMEAAAGSVSQPVAGEFRRILEGLRIGLDLEEVMQSAGDRIRVNDFRFFAATLVLQRRTGGSLAETLANLAGLIRRRKEIRLKARALSAESRATAYLIAALPFVMMGFMYLLNPVTLSLLFTDTRGQIMFGIAMFLLATGILLMRALINKAMR